MEQAKKLEFFLGANSRDGFCSLYDGFVDHENGDFLWVIKGGPGCGKSSFMRKIGRAAGAAGLSVQYILCSGDPDSLDGVYIPALKTGYVDGTAPHVIEAQYPGAASLYLDLGAFYDAGALERYRMEIMDINRDYKQLYAHAYGCIAASRQLWDGTFPGIIGGEELSHMRKRLGNICARELKPRGRGGTVQRRYISAFSCKGAMTLTATVHALCPAVYILDSELGGGEMCLAAIAEIAREWGHDAIICPHPLDIKKTQAVLLPGPGVGFLARDEVFDFDCEAKRHLRLDTMVNREILTENRPLIRRRRRRAGELLHEAEETLAQAKRLHDELEAVYNPHVDFDGLYEAAQDHISWLLNKK